MRWAAAAAALSAGVLWLWPAWAEQPSLDRLVGHGGPIRAAAVSTDGAMVATASFDNSVGLWRTDTGAHLAWLEGSEAAVNAVAFSPDGRRLASGDDAFDVILWDVAAGRLAHRLEGHRGKVMGVAFSPDGLLAASASWDGVVKLWSVDTGAPLGDLLGHQAGVNAVAFSADGARLFSASVDGSVRSWSIATRQALRDEARHGFGVNTLALDPAGAWAAYGATDGVVRVVELATGAERAALTGERRPILATALSPDGRLLAFGDGQGYITVVSVEGWRILRDFKAATRGPIWALAFAGAGALVAAGLDDDAAIWPIDAADAPLFAAVGARRFQVAADAVSNGERQFARKCSVCHTLTPDGARRAGPSLYGVFGRPAGALTDYAYSGALAASGVVWSAETLDLLFDLGPDHYTPGSKMPMQRIVKPADRRDLIEFLAAATAPRSPDATEGAPR